MNEVLTPSPEWETVTVENYPPAGVHFVERDRISTQRLPVKDGNLWRIKTERLTTVADNYAVGYPEGYRAPSAMRTPEVVTHRTLSNLVFVPNGPHTVIPEIRILTHPRCPMVDHETHCQCVLARGHANAHDFNQGNQI